VGVDVSAQKGNAIADGSQMHLHATLQFGTDGIRFPAKAPLVRIRANSATERPIAVCVGDESRLII
jgi:hypothetical protein